MTLTVGWERSTSTGSELIFASDSRLRQGGEWDGCPKVFRLPRTDSLLAFAGDTLWTYPIVYQVIATIDSFRPSRVRHYDLSATRAHAMRTMNEMMRSGSAATAGWHDIEFEFLFGGWSWREQSFRLWRLYWDPHCAEMRHDPVNAGHVGRVRFIGTRDRDRTDPTLEVVGHAKEKLSEKLRAKHGELIRGMTLDMEPWEVLVELIRAGEHPTVGGPPQLAKVYRSMNSVVFSVMWPDRSGTPTLLGRQLLGYESTDAPMLDPDSPSVNRDRTGKAS
jgi:hypothetical protein